MRRPSWSRTSADQGSSASARRTASSPSRPGPSASASAVCASRSAGERSSAWWMRASARGRAPSPSAASVRSAVRRQSSGASGVPPVAARTKFAACGSSATTNVASRMPRAGTRPAGAGGPLNISKPRTVIASSRFAGMWRLKSTALCTRIAARPPARPQRSSGVSPSARAQSERRKSAGTSSSREASDPFGRRRIMRTTAIAKATISTAPATPVSATSSR